MKLAIRLYLAHLSISHIKCGIENFRVKRSPKAVHSWVQKEDLQPASGNLPNHVALDETMIQSDDDRFWRYTAVDPVMNHVLDIRLYPRRRTAITEILLGELEEKHYVADALFLVAGPLWLQTVLNRHSFRVQRATHGIGTPSNVSTMRVKVKHICSQIFLSKLSRQPKNHGYSHTRGGTIRRDSCSPESSLTTAVASPWPHHSIRPPSSNKSNEPSSWTVNPPITFVL